VTPLLLDLFCKAGGCTKGYQEAGFEVWGVDIEPQPNYCGDRFFRMDAREALRNRAWGWPLWHMVDAIHASPPCQFATDYIRTGNVKDSPNLIPETRRLLNATGLPYVIENVQGAKDDLRDPVLICGSMFDPQMDIRRHRLFETNWPLSAPTWPCRHKLHGPDRFPGGRSKERGGTSTALVRNTIEIGSWDIPYERQAEAMGVDWPMTLPELSNAIPPAYTEFIGRQLLAHVQQGAIAA
jgi:DNA (cytosine-5)-methyltransferase 1